MNNTNVRQVLLSLGMPPFLATMTIPFMFQMPGTSDPDSPSVIEIVKTVQNGLHALGYKRIKVTGVIDRETAAAMNQISGSWRQQTWLEIAGNVLATIRDPDRKARQMAAVGLGDFEAIKFGPSPRHRGYGPIPGWMVGLPAGPLGMGDFAMKSSSKGPIARPLDAKTLGEFQGLQRAINIGRAAKGMSSISVDGDIGPGTLVAAQSIGFSFSSTEALARSAASVASSIATTFGGAPNLSPDPTRAAVKVTSVPGLPLVVDPGGASKAGFGLDQLGPYGKYILLGLGAAGLAVALKKRRKR